MTLLVATDAAEEGIDVADCEFVIRFNWFGTTKSHIQGSGRARKAGSTCYYFENDGSAEQQHAQRLTDVARDDGLALSADARAAHHDSYDSRFTTRTQLYPYQPQGEASVNLSNAGKILRDYCAAVLRQQVAPKALCTFRSEVVCDSPQQRRRTLLSVRFPTPEGWQTVAKDESDADLKELFNACGTEIVRHPRYHKVNTEQKDVQCFFYVVVVRLRQKELLDAMNRPTTRARNYSALACEAMLKERTWSLKPKFRGVITESHDGEGDGGGGGHQRGGGESAGGGGGGGVGGGGGRRGGDESEEGDDGEEQDEVLSDDEVHDVQWEVVGEDTDELTGSDDEESGSISALHSGRDENAAQTGPAQTGPTSPGGDAGTHGEGKSLALQDLKTQVDRRGWKIRWEENKLSEQEFRARVILDMGNEDAELPWSGVYLGLKRAKQAAAELALASMTRQLVESATSSALASASPLPSSPSEKNSAVSSPTWSGSALQDLKTVMDRQQRSFRWEEERVSEQVWRARIVLPQPGGHDSVLAWSEPCLGLKKAKQAAAAIALGHVNQSISP